MTETATPPGCGQRQAASQAGRHALPGAPGPAEAVTAH